MHRLKSKDLNSTHQGYGLPVFCFDGNENDKPERCRSPCSTGSDALSASSFRAAFLINLAVRFFSNQGDALCLLLRVVSDLSQPEKERSATFSFKTVRRLREAGH